MVKIPNPALTFNPQNISTELSPLAVTAEQAAAAFQVSPRHWASLVSRGLAPAPIRLSGSVRWNSRELAAWADAGCPSRDKWEAMQSDSRGAA